MGIQINGQTDTITATDGGFTIQGASGNLTGNLTGNVTGNVNATGVSTVTDLRVGTAVTANSSGVQVGAGKSIRLYGASSGYSDIIAAAGSASTTFTLPANGGSASQYLQTDGSGGLSWQTVTDDAGAEWTDATRQNTSGANEYLFTGLPTNVRELVLTLENVSWTTGSNLQVQLGTSGGLVGGGSYKHGYAHLSQGSTVTNGRVASDAFVIGIWTSASHGINGTIRFTNIYDNNWSVEGILHTSLDNTLNTFSGRVDLGGTLERIAIQNRAGNNFDGGAVNIHYITTQP